MRTLLLARHAHARSNVGDVVSSLPPGEGLSDLGVEEARALGETLASEPIGLGVATRLARTQETLALALAGRDVPRIVLPGLGEIGFGAYEGGPLDAYRSWAWSHAADAPCPGAGESRVQAAQRIATGLDALLERAENVILAISHALPVRYVLDASDGAFPAARITPVPHARPFALTRDQVLAAAATLRRWAGAPGFRDA